MNACKAKGFLSFDKKFNDWEVLCRGKNNHFKIKPRDS